MIRPRDKIKRNKSNVSTLYGILIRMQFVCDREICANVIMAYLKNHRGVSADRRYATLLEQTIID